MIPCTSLRIADRAAYAIGPLHLIENHLVQIAGSLTPTPYGTLAAETAARAVLEHSSSTLIVHDGPGVAAAALEVARLAAPDRLVVVARRAIEAWHATLATEGALVLDGHSATLGVLTDTALIVEQPTTAKPEAARVACIPGPILSPLSAGSNELLLDPTVEVVPDLEAWARRLSYVAPRPRNLIIPC